MSEVGVVSAPELHDSWPAERRRHATAMPLEPLPIPFGLPSARHLPGIQMFVGVPTYIRRAAHVVEACLALQCFFCAAVTTCGCKALRNVRNELCPVWGHTHWMGRNKVANILLDTEKRCTAHKVSTVDPTMFVGIELQKLVSALGPKPKTLFSIHAFFSKPQQDICPTLLSLTSCHVFDRYF